MLKKMDHAALPRRSQNGLSFCTRLFAASCACVLMAGCGRVENRMEIVETRDISKYEADPQLHASSSKQFLGKDPTPPAEDLFKYDVPAGWTKGPTTEMRMLNFAFGAEGEGECYLSVIREGGGDLLANVNRWRKQMGLPDVTQADVDQLPKRPLMGTEGSYVAIDGDFTGFGMAEPKKGYRMLGVIAVRQDMGLFVKMTGPKALIEQQSAAFDQFVNSLAVNLPGDLNPGQ